MSNSPVLDASVGPLESVEETVVAMAEVNEVASE